MNITVNNPKPVQPPPTETVDVTFTRDEVMELLTTYPQQGVMFSSRTLNNLLRYLQIRQSSGEIR